MVVVIRGLPRSESRALPHPVDDLDSTRQDVCYHPTSQVPLLQISGDTRMRQASKRKRFVRTIQTDLKLSGYYTTTLLKAIRDGYVHDLPSLAQFARREGREFSDVFKRLSVHTGTSREYKYPTQGALESLKALLEARLVTAEGIEAALDSLQRLREVQRATLRRLLAESREQAADDKEHFYIDPPSVEFPLEWSSIPSVIINTASNWREVQKSLNISLAVLAELQQPGALVVRPPEYYQLYDGEEYSDILVFMPFCAEVKPIYEDHISAVCERRSLSVSRADDYFNTTFIMAEVWAAIRSAKAVIADCTGRNANVFYEIGISHALGKEVIIIAQSKDDIPFDIQHIRHIEYEYTPSGMRKFEEALEKTLLKLSIKGSDGTHNH